MQRERDRRGVGGGGRAGAGQSDETKRGEFPEYVCANPECKVVLNSDGQPISLVECRNCNGRIFIKTVSSRAIRYSTR